MFLHNPSQVCLSWAFHFGINSNFLTVVGQCPQMQMGNLILRDKDPFSKPRGDS